MTLQAVRIWDCRAKCWASAEYKPTAANIKRARSRCDKLDNQYGACRYTVKHIYAD